MYISMGTAVYGRFLRVSRRVDPEMGHSEILTDHA